MNLLHQRGKKMKVLIEEGEVDLLEKHIPSKLNLRLASLPPEYFYASLPLCVIDSVFSIHPRINKGT